MNDQDANQTEDAYGTFCGPIDQNSARAISGMIGISTTRKFKHVHILFQSSGGSVGDGIFIHNILKSSPIRVTVYNSGTVASAGVVAYLGAETRKVSRVGTFMIHRCVAHVNPACSASRLEAAAKSLLIDDRRTWETLSKVTTLDAATWANLRDDEAWFTAEDAVKNGIATEIGEFCPPKGVELVNIF